MNEDLRNDYDRAKAFWNTAFFMDETTMADAAHSADKDTGWRQMAPSEKLFEAARSLGDRKKILDYGCGRGWAAIIAAKSGCANVTAVEPAENAVNTARFYSKLYGVDNQIQVMHISENWLSEAAAASYDGAICSNVLDVVPEDVAENIIKNLARVAQEDSPVIIGMNYYMEPKENPEKNMTVKHGNHVYVNDILRLVCRTDEEWRNVLGRYFSVEKLDLFAWPGEETERRRLFYLRKKPADR